MFTEQFLGETSYGNRYPLQRFWIPRSNQRVLALDIYHQAREDRADDTTHFRFGIGDQDHSREKQGDCDRIARGCSAKGGGR